MLADVVRLEEVDMNVSVYLHQFVTQLSYSSISYVQHTVESGGLSSISCSQTLQVLRQYVNRAAEPEQHSPLRPFLACSCEVGRTLFRVVSESHLRPLFYKRYCCGSAASRFMCVEVAHRR